MSLSWSPRDLRSVKTNATPSRLYYIAAHVSLILGTCVSGAAALHKSGLTIDIEIYNMNPVLSSVLRQTRNLRKIEGSAHSYITNWKCIAQTIKLFS